MLALERTLTERQAVLQEGAPPSRRSSPQTRPRSRTFRTESAPLPPQSPRSAAPHHGDSCGVGPRRLRPQPRRGHGAGPRAGLRRGAPVQQPVLHRGGRVRDGVVSPARASQRARACVFSPTGARVYREITAAGCTRVAWIDGKT